MVIEVTRENIKKVLPSGQCPCAYMLIDKNNSVMYIGKASVIRGRLFNHFNGN